MVDGLGQERLPDIAVQPLLFSPPFRRVGFRVHQADAQHPAGPGQPRVRKRRSVISIEDLGQAAAGDRPAQQVLAGAGVLVREEPAVDQQPGMIIDDQEQPGPRRPLPARVRHPRADQHVGDPPLVRPGRLVPAVGLRLGGQRLAVQPGTAQLPADGPLGDRAPRAGDTRSRRSARPTGRAAPAAARRPRRTAPGGRAPRRCRPAARACSASSPPLRHARSHRSIVPREYVRDDPSGCAWARAAICRTSAAALARGQPVPAASAITAQRCNAICSCPL